jgi:hypothetical protein
MLEPETVLAGRYRITGVIAQGGMGTVYRALDERLLRPVAVKTVGRNEPQLTLRLRREARLLARLSHPNIVRLFDVVEHEGQPHLVNELVEGSSLRGLLGRLTRTQIAVIGEQIANALGAAHALDIVHRDLKPSNVLVGDRARLLDFGIARQVEDDTLTTSEGIVGTASYLAPERLHGEDASPASDLYALGLVLVECFSGQPAFSGTFAETVALRISGRPDLPDSVPGDWHPLVAALADPDPAGRPDAGTAAEALRGLRAVAVAATGPPATLGATPPATRPAPPPAPPPPPPPDDGGVGTAADAGPPARSGVRRPGLRRAALPATAAAAALVAGTAVALMMRPDTPAAPAAGAVEQEQPAGAPPGASGNGGVTATTAAGGSRAVALAPPGDQQPGAGPGDSVPAPDPAAGGAATAGGNQGNGNGNGPGGGGNGSGNGSGNGGGQGNGGNGGGQGGGVTPPTVTIPAVTTPPVTAPTVTLPSPPTTTASAEQAPGLLTPVHNLVDQVTGLTGGLLPPLL